MIAISKAEKNIIIKQFPKAHIVRTMKQKSKRHRYYCEEKKGILHLLNQIRNNGIVNKKRKDDKYTVRKKTGRV